MKVIMKCVNIKLWDILGCFHYILNAPRIPNTYYRIPNKQRFCLNSLHAEQRFFLCPKHCLNFTDLSPSGPARRFAEPDLGLNCLYDNSQTFSF